MKSILTYPGLSACQAPRVDPRDHPHGVQAQESSGPLSLLTVHWATPCPLGLSSGSVPPLTSPPGLQVLCLQLRSLPRPHPPLGGVSWKMVRSSSDSWTFAGSPCWPSCSLWLFLEAECQPIPKLLKGHMHPDTPRPSLGPRRMGMGPAGSVLGGNGHPPNPDSQVPEALPHKERI